MQPVSTGTAAASASAPGGSGGRDRPRRHGQRVSRRRDDGAFERRWRSSWCAPSSPPSELRRRFLAERRILARPRPSQHRAPDRWRRDRRRRALLRARARGRRADRPLLRSPGAAGRRSGCGCCIVVCGPSTSRTRSSFSTATSRPPTCWWTTPGSPSSWTSASPSCSPRQRGRRLDGARARAPADAASGRAPSSCAATRSPPPPTSIRWACCSRAVDRQAAARPGPENRPRLRPRDRGTRRPPSAPLRLRTASARCRRPPARRRGRQATARRLAARSRRARWRPSWSAATARVAEFADDLERYLAGRAVSAHPPSVRYRLGKFLRRHRAAAAAVVVAIASLVAATGGEHAAGAHRRGRAGARRAPVRRCPAARQRRALRHPLGARQRGRRDGGAPAAGRHRPALPRRPRPRGRRRAGADRGAGGGLRAHRRGPGHARLAERGAHRRRAGELRAGARAAAAKPRPGRPRRVARPRRGAPTAPHRFRPRRARRARRRSRALEAPPSRAALRAAPAGVDRDARRPRAGWSWRRRWSPWATTSGSWATCRPPPARYGAALAVARRRSAADPASTLAMRQVGVVEQRLGDAAAEAGDWPRARAHHLASLAVDRKLAALRARRRSRSGATWAPTSADWASTTRRRAAPPRRWRCIAKRAVCARPCSRRSPQDARAGEDRGGVPLGGRQGLERRWAARGGRSARWRWRSRAGAV